MTEINSDCASLSSAAAEKRKPHHDRAARIDFPTCATATGMKLKTITSDHGPGPRRAR